MLPSPTMDAILAQTSVLPMLTIDDAGVAVPLARALVDGGLRVMEVASITDAGLAALIAITAQVPEAVVGVGTVTQLGDVPRAVQAGARFAMSPGLSRELAAAAHAFALPYLPGVMTPSEMMEAQEMGFAQVGFFPAVTAGGRPMLKAVLAVFPRLRFCPYGGIGSDNVSEWLALPNVACVAGSWIAPPEDVGARAWDRIRIRAARAARLR